MVEEEEEEEEDFQEVVEDFQEVEEGEAVEEEVKYMTYRYMLNSLMRIAPWNWGPPNGQCALGGLMVLIG